MCVCVGVCVGVCACARGRAHRRVRARKRAVDNLNQPMAWRWAIESASDSKIWRMSLMVKFSWKKITMRFRCAHGITIPNF